MSVRAVRPAASLLVITLLLGHGSLADAGAPSAASVTPDGSAVAHATVDGWLHAVCLDVRATLSLVDRPDWILRSTGTYDPSTGVGDFSHTLRDDETGATFVVHARHQDGRIAIGPASTEASSPSGMAVPSLVTTPSDLARGSASDIPELARVGRYQPGAAIEFLYGINPAGPWSSPSDQANPIDVTVDLDEAAAIGGPRVQAAVDAFRIRRIPARLRLDDPTGDAGSIEYRIDVPSGAGGVAQQLTWFVSVTPIPAGPGCSPITPQATRSP